MVSKLKDAFKRLANNDSLAFARKVQGLTTNEILSLVNVVDILSKRTRESDYLNDQLIAKDLLVDVRDKTIKLLQDRLYQLKIENEVKDTRIEELKGALTKLLETHTFYTEHDKIAIDKIKAALKGKTDG